MTVLLITAFLFQPIGLDSERLDRHFYRDRYDYRTLVEFARELSSETDLETTLAIVGERLLQTWASSLVFFLARETGRPVFRLQRPWA